MDEIITKPLTWSEYLSPTGCFGSNFIFCTTGVFQVIIVQWLDYHGLDGGSTGLTVLSSYLGLLIFSIPFTFSNRDDGKSRYHPMFTVCILSDVVSNICNQLSISMCGSALFMLIYSSIIVFSALLRWKIYNMGITRQQVKALAVITLGLLITAFDGAETIDENEGNLAQFNLSETSSESSESPSITSIGNETTATVTEGLHTADPGRIVLGMFLALCGAFGYAWVYVLSEQITIDKNNPPSPYAFAAYGGFYGTSLCSTYIVLFVGPHWTRDIIHPIQSSGASYFSVVSLYCLLLFMCGAHNLSFVFLGKNGGGAVVAGVNKAVQTISVFVISALIFGPSHVEQRMTSYKVAALILVVVGVLMYASAKNGTNKKKWKAIKMEEGDQDGISDFDDDNDDDDDDPDNEFGLADVDDQDGTKVVEMSRIRARTQMESKVPLSITCLLFICVLSFNHKATAFPNGTGNTVMFAPFLEAPIATIPKSYLSFNFDWNLNATKNDAWTNASIGFSLDLQNKHLIKLASSLAPANLRVGGSSADAAEYQFGTHNCSRFAVEKHVCLTEIRWDELIEFCQKTGLRLVFDLNIMRGRTGTGISSWDSSNAFALITYTQKNYPIWSTKKNLAFELGNEKEFALTFIETANAFKKLRQIIDTVFQSVPRNNRPILIGPSMNIRTDWLTNFLNALSTNPLSLSSSSSPILDVISYHMYPGYGRSIDLPSLIMQPAWLDFSHSIADQVKASILISNSNLDLLNGQTELWIDETAAAWASGTAGVCNGFLSGFWYLDQLASMATKGHGAMARQCLVGGNYSLIEQRNIYNNKNILIQAAFTPNPDYWTAWMWRHLVAGTDNDTNDTNDTTTATTTTMLAVNQVMPYEGDFVPETRMYLVCTPITSPHYIKGSVTGIWLNQANENKSILMYQGQRMTYNENNVNDIYFDELKDSPAVPPNFPNLPRIEYILTPKNMGGDEGDGDGDDNKLLSRQILVNDVWLVMDKDGSMPILPNGRDGITENMIVPSSSYGFVIYPNANASGCLYV